MPKKIIIVSPEVFTIKELKKYEQLILDNKDINELEASIFFTKFPKFLTVGGYRQIAKEVVLYKSSGEPMFRVDFFRKKFGEIYWDFVELKSPKVPFIIKRANHWKFSAEIESGVQQAHDYSDFLETDLHRLELENRTGIKAFRPKILLVGGRRDINVDPIEIRRLASRYNNIDIQSYDDIYEFALDNYRTSMVAIPIVQNWDIIFPGSEMEITVDLVRLIVSSLVNEPNAIDITVIEGDFVNVIELRAAPQDLGYIIGKNGIVARSIRTILGVISLKMKKRLILEIFG